MPNNVPVDIVDLLINDLLKGIGIGEAYALIVAQIPLLGWGPIGWILDLVLTWVGGYIFTAIAKYAAFAVIDWQTISENANYTQAVVALKAAQAANDPVALGAATTQFQSTLGKLIHFDGS